MEITEAATTDANMAVGNNVILCWLSPFIITVDTGDILSNVKNIEAGNYQIFDGAGDIDFLDGTFLKLDWFPRLRAVITWIESEKVTLSVTKSHIVDFTDTIPINIHTVFHNGGEFDDDGGAITLTFDGPFEAGLYKIFNWTGSGDVFMGDTAPIEFVRPEYWGAIPDGTAGNDCYAAIISALTSLNNHGKVKFSRGVYATSAPIVITDTLTDRLELVLEGTSPKESIIYHYGAQANGCIKLTADGNIVDATYSITANMGACHIRNLGLGSKGGPALWQEFTAMSVHENILFYSAGTTSAYLKNSGSAQCRYYNLKDMGNDDMPDDVNTLITALGRTTPYYGFQFENGSYAGRAGITAEHFFWGCRLDGIFTREAIKIESDTVSTDNIGEYFFYGSKFTGPSGVTDFGIVSVDGAGRGVFFNDCYLEQQGGAVTVPSIRIDNANGLCILKLADTVATGYIDLGLSGGPVGNAADYMQFSMINSSADKINLHNTTNLNKLVLVGNHFGLQSTTMSGVYLIDSYHVVGNTVGSTFVPLQCEGTKMGSTGATGVVINSASDTATSSYIRQIYKSKGTYLAPTILSDGDTIYGDNFYYYDGANFQQILSILIKADDLSPEVGSLTIGSPTAATTIFKFSEYGLTFPISTGSGTLEANVSINSVYIDSVTGVLSFKDAGSNIHVLE